MLWEIVGTPHRLLGSVHVLPPEVILPDWFDSSQRGIERIIFESDNRISNQIGIDKTGAHLKSPKASATYDTAKTLLASLGTNEPFGAFLPWRMAFVIAKYVIPTIGLSYEHGVDHRLRGIADKKGLTVDFLESPTRSFELIDSSCKTADAGLAFLKQVITDAISGAGQLELQRIVRDWFVSDLADFADIRIKEIALLPLIFNPILVQRDREWLPVARTKIADKIPTLFVVGALHTVGQGSFIEQLNSAGFQLKQISLK